MQQNEPYRLRYTNQIVGLFLILLLLLVTGLAWAFTRNTRIFVNLLSYTVASMSEKDAADLRTGTDVVILGKRIGEVTSLEYSDNSDKVTIGLGIDPKYANLITTDSVFSLERRFGVGAVYVRIKRQARLGAEPPQPLDPRVPIRLATGEVDRVEQIATDVSKASNSISGIETRLAPTLESVKDASDEIASSMRNSITPAADESKLAFDSVTRTSDELRRSTQILSRELSELTEQISMLARVEIPSTLDSLKEAAVAATQASESVAVTSDSLNEKSAQTNKEVSQTLSELRQTLLQITKLTDESRELVQVIRGEADELPGTVRGLNRTVGEAEDLVGEIRSHWLLRNVRTEPTYSRPIPPSSLRPGGMR